LSQLDLLQFPLGALYKEEKRLKAKNFGLPVAETPASQDLCC
jgi:tRNA U34 2-thiouridine synthase MnmA/TrmU